MVKLVYDANNVGNNVVIAIQNKKNDISGSLLFTFSQDLVIINDNYLRPNLVSAHYPEIGNANFKCTLCTFKRQLAFKMRVHYGISIVLL